MLNTSLLENIIQSECNNKSHTSSLHTLDDSKIAKCQQHLNLPLTFLYGNTIDNSNHDTTPLPQLRLLYYYVDVCNSST